MDKEPDNAVEEAVKEIEDKKVVTEKPNPTEVKAVARVFGDSMSENIGNLAGALAKAQGLMSNGKKEKAGFNYKYMELGALTDIARPALAKNEIALVQSHEFIKSSKPTVVTHTTIIHSSGEWMKNSLEIPITIMKQLTAAQMIGVASTYGRRYALQAICLVASEDDTDGTTKK